MLARGVVETCEDLSVNVLFTYGAPHGGVSEYKKGQTWFNPLIKKALGYLATTSMINKFGAPLDYLR